MDQTQNSQSATPPQIKKLEDKVNASSVPPDLKEKTTGMVERLKLISREASFFLELDATSRYIDIVTSLPWSNSTQDILDLSHARQVLDKNHYGLTDVKQKILEYLSVMIVKNQRGVAGKDAFARAPIISLVGLVGVGKTTIAYSIAESLGRKIERIPFGGMGGAAMLRGQSRLYADAEPGLVIKALIRAQSHNPVILLDEIDRVSDSARGDIMGVLVELLDPEQNRAFTDHFVDYPFDLSNVLFIATSNNTKDVSTAVLDRLEIVQMPSYTDQEKIVIAKSYMMPKVLTESGLLPTEIIVQEDVWEDIVRPLGYDSGIRSLHRTIEGMVRKIALSMLEGKIPKNQQFIVSRQNVKQLIPQW